MRRKTVKTAVAIVGISALVVTALFVSFWRDAEIQYHLYLLRRDPEYLFELSLKPTGSSEREATQDFLETHDGAQFLLDSYLDLTMRGFLRSVLEERKNSSANYASASLASIKTSYGAGSTTRLTIGVYRQASTSKGFVRIDCGRHRGSFGTCTEGSS